MVVQANGIEAKIVSGWGRSREKVYALYGGRLLELPRKLVTKQLEGDPT